MIRAAKPQLCLRPHAPSPQPRALSRAHRPGRCRGRRLHDLHEQPRRGQEGRLRHVDRDVDRLRRVHDDRVRRSEAKKKPKKKAKKTYTVKPGDILSTVAEKTGLTVEELQELNPDIDPQALQVGQKLKLSGSGSSSSSGDGDATDTTTTP